jgi:hypothetical protein
LLQVTIWQKSGTDMSKFFTDKVDEIVALGNRHSLNRRQRQGDGAGAEVRTWDRRQRTPR